MIHKEFNITGTCFPELHYMADISQKFAQTMTMVQQGKYFVINRPRQYGKTTMLEAIARSLRETQEWLVFNLSFEGLGSASFQDEAAFCRAFLGLMKLQMTESNEPTFADFFNAAQDNTNTLPDLSQTISTFVVKAERKLALLIDEVDKSSNNQLFLDFLSVLRNKYLRRHLKTERTFDCVILAGLHDVKSLKLKLRPDQEQKFNSPWNIATDFTVDMNLQPNEIQPMLEEYARDNQVSLEAALIAERLFYYTSGYPFLVSKLCKIIAEQLLPEKSTRSWEAIDVELAVAKVVKETNTNFESLIKNLENNADLYEFVFKNLIEVDYQSYSIHEPMVGLGLMYGILKNGQGISIHNRIYAEVIYDYMTSKTRSRVNLSEYNLNKNFILPDQRLNMEAVLLRFQAFMREQDSLKDQNFLERNARLVFLAFIKPIINGSGYDFKEPQISEERRLDVVITYLQHKYIVELKIWRGSEAHADGLLQLVNYLDRQALSTGYLLVFEQLKQKNWVSEWVEIDGKRIFVVRV